MAEITIKSVEGNPLNINVVMTAVEHSMLNGEIVTETVDFYPDTTKPVRAYLDCTTARKQFCPTTYVDGNIVYLSCDNATAGVYTLTVTCTDINGKARRYKSDACIEVYDLTSAAEIAGTFDEQTYEMNGVFYTFGGGGATVQSDWDETNPESPAYIRNKPDLSDYATDEELQAVADTFNESAAAQITGEDIEYWNNKSDFSGSYNDLSDKPTIPPQQVQSDWNQTNTSAKDYIKNKPTIPQGVVVDSALSSTSENPVQNKVINSALGSKQDTLTFDSTPTASSTNPVTSGGVKTALDLKANQITTYTKTEVDALFDDVAYLGDDDGTATTLDFDPQSDTVWNIPQTLGSSQQAQARANIGVVDVSGTNDGTNWTSITIGSTTKAIPSGGGGGGDETNVIESISINGTTQTVTNKNVDLPVPTSSTITAIVSLTEAQYTALATKDSSTLYVILES